MTEEIPESLTGVYKLGMNVLLWPTRYSFRQVKRIGIKTLRLVGGQREETVENLKAKRPLLEVVKTTRAIQRATTEVDPELLAFSLSETEKALDVSRRTHMRIMANAMGERIMRDMLATRQKDKLMTEDLRLAFKTLTHEHLHEDETFESIGADEELVPFLYLEFPEFSRSPDTPA